MAPCKSAAKQVSFEWSHHRISLIDSKVRTTRHVSVFDSGSDKDCIAHKPLLDILILECLFSRRCITMSLYPCLKNNILITNGQI